MVTVSAPNDKLQRFIDSTCSQLNCQEIQKGGSCYEPNTLQNHASYALDLFYRARGSCNSEIGTPSIIDPCKFLSSHDYLFVYNQCTNSLSNVL